jgi:peptidoglycan/xylan/chitin deacetylase (PgdA/CDA1 family)
VNASPAGGGSSNAGAPSAGGSSGAGSGGAGGSLPSSGGVAAGGGGVAAGSAGEMVGAGAGGKPPFSFEGGAVAAVSLTYDDGLDPHLAIAQPALEAAGLRGTFFLSNFEGVDHLWALPNTTSELTPRHRAWQAAAQKGHELGGHTVNHPCDDPGKAPTYKLADYSLTRMEQELDDSVARLARLGAVAPLTFAYPCGSDKKGLGGGHDDYSPLVATRFAAARVSDAGLADPQTVELLRVPQRDAGGKTAAELKAMIDEAIAARGWLVLLFHGVGAEGSCQGSLAYAPSTCMINYLTTSAEAHAELVQYLAEKKSEIWTAPLGAVAARIAASR